MWSRKGSDECQVTSDKQEACFRIVMRSDQNPYRVQLCLLVTRYLSSNFRLTIEN